MKGLNLPKLSDLDKTSPDYAANLDDSIDKISYASKEQVEGLKKYFEESKQGLVDRLNKIEGVHAEISPVDQTSEEFSFGRLETITNLLSIRCPKSNEKKRAVEDAITAYKRVEEDKIRADEDRQKLIERTYEDFMEAVTELTEINAIIPADTQMETLHIYASSNGTVYEMHLNRHEPSKINVVENYRLTPDNLKDEQIVEKFKKASEGKKAGVYFVSNPCNSIGPTRLIHDVVLSVLGDLIPSYMEDMFLKYKRDKNDKDPLSNLIDSLKRNI